MFWGFSNSTGESILNSLEAVYLGDVYEATVYFFVQSICIVKLIIQN